MIQVLFRRHPRERDLALFAGGELGPVARWRIEGHLNACDDCRQTVSEFFELRSRVMDLGELPAVDWSGMAARIERGVEMARREQRPAPAWRPAWAAAMALLVLLTAGVYMSRFRVQAAGPVLDASAGGVELRLSDDQVLTMVNAPQQESQVQWRASADAVSSRYLDKETGNITVTNVYSQ